MLARQPKRTIHDYASDHVFSGTRPIPAVRLAKLKASHQARHGQTGQALKVQVKKATIRFLKSIGAK